MPNNITHTGINTYVNTAALAQFEPSIEDYYRTSQTSWDTQISVGLREVIQDLKNLNKKVKMFCTPYTLQAETTVSTTTIGTATTTEEIVERMMFVVNATGAGTWTLKGSNDGTTFYTVTTLTTALTTALTLNGLFNTPYKFYRIDYAGSSSTFSAYLVETSFYLAHVYKALHIIYMSLTNEAEADSVFRFKSDYYHQQYMNQMNNMNASYDSDLSGSIDEDEISQLKVMRLTR